ncbi:MAG: universal stress protein [Acidimicrobiales bacterium]
MERSAREARPLGGAEQAGSPVAPERIVVGLDGSEGSKEALRFAVGEARLRGAAVEVVHCWRLPSFGQAGTYIPLDAVEAVKDEAERLADHTVKEVLGGDPPVPVVVRTFDGAPAEVLVDVSEGASMLVVGTRGRGGFRGLLLGSVSQQVSHHASCPVVTVPERRSS